MIARKLRDQADAFGEWADREKARGRPESELIFGNFVAETGYSVI